MKRPSKPRREMISVPNWIGSSPCWRQSPAAERAHIGFTTRQDLDEMIAKLSGEGEKSAITIPVENDCASGRRAMRLLNC